METIDQYYNIVYSLHSKLFIRNIVAAKKAKGFGALLYYKYNRHKSLSSRQIFVNPYSILNSKNLWLVFV